MDARRLMGSRRPEREALLPEGGKGAVVVGPEAARCAGARMRLLAWVGLVVVNQGCKINETEEN